MEQYCRRAWMPAARVVTWGGSKKHARIAYLSSKLRRFVHWIAATAVMRGWQLKRSKSKFLLPRP